ncbi:MAG TPA: hypothetical protein VFS78_08700 [Vicinamibacteria bacterium]|nr:hypothetical protein [Vicinamibacteria bacterium]
MSLLEKAYDERAIEWLGFATVLTERLRMSLVSGPWCAGWACTP